MKTRKKLLDNKGAALVTILIAVTFMTIMASSLMYMAYMNYLTKSMRYSATDNFYTDEFALDELSTSLQQVAAEADSIDSAKKAIVDAVCGIGGGETCKNNGYPIYDFDCVKEQITLASQEATISVNCALIDQTTGLLSEAALIDAGNAITLKGLMLTATTPKGYQSTITVDVMISFPNTLPGTMDLNDFSIMADSPILFNNGGSHYYSGNMYVQSTDDEAAIQLNNGATVGILSPNAMVVGDIVISGKSILHITGDMTVYGTITMDDDSMLICTGTLRHEGIYGGTIKGDVTRDPMDIEMHNRLKTLVEANQGLVNSLFQEVYIYGSFQDSPPDVGWHEWTLEDFAELNNNYSMREDGISCWVMGQFYQTYNASETYSDGSYKYNNALILSTEDLVFNGQFENTTVLTTGMVNYLTEQGTTYMGRMADEDYQAAKDMTFYINAGQLRVRRSSGSLANFNGNIFGTGSIADSAVADTYEVASGVVGSPSRVFKIDNNNKNYFPVGYFIVENASTIVSDIMGAPAGQQDPSKSYITYRLWNKD